MSGARRGGACAILALVLSGCGGCEPEGLGVEDAEAFYAKQPRYLRPIPYTETPEGLADLSAETCGACHQAIYAEWKISTHARAWLDDAQFLEEVEKSEKQGVAWMCMNCHTPLVNQLPRLVAGLEGGSYGEPMFVDNPRFDEKLQKEAITCATCHVKDGVVLGPTGEAEGSPHPVKKSEALGTVEVCVQCHQAEARFDDLELICTFKTGREHAASPQAAAGETCQSCHMPKVERPRWVGGTEAKPVARHWFGGSLIPKKPEYAEEIAALQAHFPPGLEVRVQELPKRVPPGRRVLVEIEIENARAGHYLPTGDPERFLKVNLRAVGPDGTVLAKREERIGTVYQWHPEVKLLSDNRLAPEEARKIAFAFEAPEEGPVTVEVEASRHRISEENMDYHDLHGRYVAGQTFFEHTEQIRVEDE